MVAVPAVAAIDLPVGDADAEFAAGAKEPERSLPDIVTPRPAANRRGVTSRCMSAGLCIHSPRRRKGKSFALVTGRKLLHVSKARKVARSDPSSCQTVVELDDAPF